MPISDSLDWMEKRDTFVISVLSFHCDEAHFETQSLHPVSSQVHIYAKDCYFSTILLYRRDIKDNMTSFCCWLP